MLGTYHPLLLPLTNLSHSNPNPVSSDDQVKAYIRKIMSQLNKWMLGGKISKLVVVITSKETGEHIERWQFDVQIYGKESSSSAAKSRRSAENGSGKVVDKENTAPE